MTKCEKLLLLLAALFYAALAGTLSGADDPALTVSPSFALPPAASGETALVLRTQIDLNTATGKELTALPGVGDTLAERIVSWREKNGPFTSVEDLLYIEGVGETTLAKLYKVMEEP